MFFVLFLLFTTSSSIRAFLPAKDSDIPSVTQSGSDSCSSSEICDELTLFESLDTLLKRQYYDKDSLNFDEMRENAVR